MLDGAKALVARAGECELFVIGADAAGVGPALFVVERAHERTVGAGRTGDGSARGEDEPAAARRRSRQRERTPRRRRPVAGVCRVRAAGANRWCALAVGTAQAVLDYVIPYVKDRKAFGESIANRQAVAFAVSDIAIESSGMRLATYRAASLADRGKDFARAAAIARTPVRRHGMQIGSHGVQLLGGHGFTKEHPVERWYRDLRAAGVMEGALLV